MALRTLGLFSKFLAILILSAVTSPLPVRRQVPEDRECNFNITEPEAQNIICLRDALDSAVPEITRFVRMEFVDHDDIYFVSCLSYTHILHHYACAEPAP